MPIIIIDERNGRRAASGDLTCRVGHRITKSDGTADGVFAAWRWTGTDLHLELDRHGFFPLFTASVPPKSDATSEARRSIVSTDLVSLLDVGVDRAFDYDALAVFLRLGFFVGDDTPFAAIRVVPPARGIVPPPARVKCRDAAIDEFLARFDAAIAARLPDGPYHLPLSGGRDSRHILLALAAAGRPPEACVTIDHFPPRGDDDVRVAAELCRPLHIRHVVVRQCGERLATEQEKNARTHFCTDEHAQFVTLAAYLRSATRVTYDGIAGDVLSQSSYLNPDVQALFERRDERAIVDYLLDGYGTMTTDAALERMLAPDLLREVSRERAVARLVREVRRHLDAPNPVASLFFWNRTRREIALSPYALLRDVTVHAPFLDAGVVDLLASLPAAMLMNRRFHTDAIARAYPDVAGVPYEAKGQRVTRRGWQRRFARDLMRDVIAAPLLHTRALLPRAIATLVDGDPARLWWGSLAIYLAQLEAVARRA